MILTNICKYAREIFQVVSMILQIFSKYADKDMTGISLAFN